ncbi:hypothetical protein [Curtobacterium pusillum]|uniref:hypothetical protein n=1 Tax=Curtobacterium pusillum TaxID=69373 RepID=UPI0011A002B1|nr:hypothetical protein [Curtobacterium pusillum]
MEDAADLWVQRLRDGVVPRPWPVVVAAALLALGAAAALVAEFSGPAVFDHVTGSRGRFWLVVFPLFLVVLGISIVIGTWWSGRRDRRILARVRETGRTPAFFLPVTTTSLRTTEELPRPRPEVWTVDAAGLHGWAPRRDAPVMDLPWSRIRRIDLATKDSRGTRVDYALWFDLTDGSSLVLPPRTTLGRPFEAGPTKLDVLMRVLRSLRRELAHGTARQDAVDGTT